MLILSVASAGNWETTTTYPGTDTPQDAKMFWNAKYPYYLKCNLYEMKCSEPEICWVQASMVQARTSCTFYTKGSRWLRDFVSCVL